MAKITIIDVASGVNEKLKIDIIEKASIHPVVVIDASSGALSSRVEEMLENGKFPGNADNLNLEVTPPLLTEQQAIQFVYEFITNYNEHVTTLVINFGNFLWKFSPELFPETHEVTGTSGVASITTRVIKFLLDTLVFDRVILFNRIPSDQELSKREPEHYPGNVKILEDEHGVKRMPISDLLFDEMIAQTYSDPDDPDVESIADPRPTEHLPVESRQHHDLRKGFVTIGFSLIDTIPQHIASDLRSLLVAIDDNKIIDVRAAIDEIEMHALDPSINSFMFLVNECLMSPTATLEGKRDDPAPLDDENIIDPGADVLSKAKDKEKEKLVPKWARW